MKRRSFLRASARTAAAAALGPFVLTSKNSEAAAKGVSPNGMLQHATFGTNNMAFADISRLGPNPHLKLVAAADVDLAQTAKLKAEYPDIRVYQDWRELLEKEGDQLDSVNVSVPDHMHAQILLAAIDRGLHVYGQKPLCGDIHECRLVANAVRKRKVVTQMGNQLASDKSNLLTIKLIQQGFVGKIVEIHSFSAKAWGRTEALPKQADPVPETLDWDLWLGPAEERPYLEGEYHPRNWRSRVGFGVGNMGDMGCHIFHPWFKALLPKAPLSVRSESPKPRPHSWPLGFKVHYVFPGTELTAGDSFEVTYYDGSFCPPDHLAKHVGGDAAQLPGQGSVIVGERGVIVAPHGGPLPTLHPVGDYEPFKMPAQQGSTNDHYAQFVDAVRGETKDTRSHFRFAGPMTEAVLLGTAASWFPGETLEWDAKKIAFTNKPEANARLCRSYREGWELTEVS